MTDGALDLQGAISALAAGVGVALLGFLARLAHVAIRRLTVWLQGLSGSSAWKEAAAKLDSVALVAVDTVEATLVAELLRAPPVGRLDPAQAKAALQKATSMAIEQLGPAGRQQVVDALGIAAHELPAIMASRIEAAHQSRKFYRQTSPRSVRGDELEEAETVRESVVAAESKP